MTRTEFKKLTSNIRRLNGSVPASHRGQPIIDALRNLAWAFDKLDHRREMARYHGGFKALQMTVARPL